MSKSLAFLEHPLYWNFGIHVFISLEARKDPWYFEAGLGKTAVPHLDATGMQ